ncbi:hypothetical protein NRIC_15060 [Enterococcus florum]|uniref:YokE-like PH domain-containing protein n=1 Tax=Enterococcus florum TaxID=2480627 RepID=A0A4P5P6Q5_9ENTE|nr:hypothetical protein [Enterococcus florum]GCF93615.1 hypothetical protein NRIC_15060 [Enterococcus florum]
MKSAQDLYQFAQTHQIHFNAKEKKGVSLFEKFLTASPTINYTFSFIGFHKYESFKNHEGLTAYAISGNTLYAVSQRNHYTYNLYHCQKITGQKRINGIKLTLAFPKEIFKIDLGFADGDLVVAALEQSRKNS